MPKFAVALSIAGSLTSYLALTAPAVAQSCRHAAERSASIDFSGAKRVVLAARAGELKIRGEQGRRAVEVAGRACASSEELLAGVDIDSRREGDTVYVSAVTPDTEGVHFGMRYAQLHLEILAPETAEFSVTDSSGDLEIRNVRSASVQDSSGDQSIREIAGDLEVQDSSGEISIERIGGAVRVRDSSGDLEIEDVRGEVEVIVDSSGDIDIERVGGGVRIRRDSSGDIEVAQVQGDVLIDSDSSGGITVDRIGGKLTVQHDGSGSIRHTRVLGGVSIPSD